jgi:hypothetical protein
MKGRPKTLPLNVVVNYLAFSFRAWAGEYF